jgi:TrmH family RNA methyltransferase
MTTRNILANIRIVLIKTSHPGNIGSAARAMKTMGLSELYLVKPKIFPDKQAIAMSSNATDILDNATVVETLQDALTDCHLVVGTSARSERTLKWDILEPKECSQQLLKQAKKGKVAVIFGRESSGLSNDELAMCQHLVNIPTNPEYSSLNIASAVQIISYECRMASLAGANANTNTVDIDESEELVTADVMEGYYKHLEAAMIESAFLDPENPKHLMARLRRLYGRIGVTPSEINILRGMLSSFQRKK